MKTIKLRGISRKPSDRNNSDGGCSDSINLCVVQDELAPMLVPRDVTSELIGSGNGDDWIVFIHTIGMHKNFITINEDGDIKAYVNKSLTDVLATVSGDYKGATAIGNTLMVSTTEHIYYFLWKDGEYQYLGTKIPEPELEVVAVPAADIKTATTFTEDILGKTGWSLTNNGTITIGEASYTGVSALLAIIKRGESQESYTISTGTYAGTTFRCSDYVNQLTDHIWMNIDLEKYNARLDHKFTTPVFLRYALKLYDGSYIYQSVPILLHNGNNRTVREYLSGLAEARIFSNVFTVEGTINFDCDGWGDIVKSVDIFLSTDVNNPVPGNKPISGEFNILVPDNIQVLDLFFKEQTNDFAADMVKQLLTKDNFYLVKSFSMEDLATPDLSFTIDPMSQDELVVKQTLPDDYLSHHELSGSGTIMSYNRRLALSGTRTTLYQGFPFLASQVYDENEVSKNYMFKYFIKTESGDVHTVLSDYVPNSMIDDAYGTPRAWLFYPDPRCFKVEVYDGTTTAYSIQMKEHPALNGAYAAWDLTEGYDFPGTAMTVIGWPSPDEQNPTFEEKGVIYMSEPYNPFVFGYSGRLSFPSEVLTMATTTKPLSSGQFGQFPLYVFTNDGIWAVPIADDGAFGGAQFLSLDVALSSDCVTPIDQAVVFTTSRGVLMLTDSSIRPISQSMAGPTSPLTYDTTMYWEGLEWENFETSASDSSPFIDFMSEAKCLYDYTGARLVFFNTDFDYQYVFMLESETWHKMVVDYGYKFQNLVNSYPDSIVCVCVTRGAQEYYALKDYSNRYDVERDPSSPEYQTLKGVVVTRAMDFDEPFVQKTITALRVRGYIDRDPNEQDKVRYQVLASEDGVHFGLLKSLRGKSYKFYKIVILTGLYVDERLSWLEVEYESRRKNKIR